MTFSGIEASLAAAVGVDVVMERNVLRVTTRKAEQDDVPISKKMNKGLVAIVRLLFRSPSIIAERITVIVVEKQNRRQKDRSERGGRGMVMMPVETKSSSPTVVDFCLDPLCLLVLFL